MDQTSSDTPALAEPDRLGTYLLTPRQYHAMRLAQEVLRDFLERDLFLVPKENLHDQAFKEGWHQAFQKCKDELRWLLHP